MRKKLKILFILILLLVLIAGGFALGVYLRLFDTQSLNEEYGLHEEEIEKQQKERETAEKKRVTKLARLYNDMKPADAAKVMETLDIDLCIAILQRMDESNAAKVMTAFEPGRAAEITQIIYEGVPRRAAKARSAAANAPAPGTEPAENTEPQQ